MVPLSHSPHKVKENNVLSDQSDLRVAEIRILYQCAVLPQLCCLTWVHDYNYPLQAL